jgi:hypothetical protein
MQLPLKYGQYMIYIASESSIVAEQSSVELHAFLGTTETTSLTYSFFPEENVKFAKSQSDCVLNVTS